MIETYSIKYPKFKRRTAQKILIAGAFIIAFAVFIFFTTTPLLLSLSIIVMVCTAFLLSYLSKQREDPVPYFDKPLIISPKAIRLGSFTYKLDDVVNLEIEINEFDGEEKIIRGSDRYILNGTDNRLSFIFLDKRIATNFYLISEVQKDQLREIFHYWYINRIPFYECDKSGKTYLLEKLNYKEIQEFKKNYF